MLKTFRGVADEGLIRLEEPVRISDGTEVLVTVLSDQRTQLEAPVGIQSYASGATVFNGIIHVDDYSEREYSVYYERRFKTEPQLELEIDQQFSIDSIKIIEQRTDGFKVKGKARSKRIIWSARGE